MSSSFFPSEGSDLPGFTNQFQCGSLYLLIGPAILYHPQGEFPVFDRTWICVPKLRRVFGCFRPKGIAASRDSLGELVWRPLPESPVRTTLAVFRTPSLHDLLDLRQLREPMRIQTLCPKRSVERFYERIIRRFSRPGKHHLHSILLCPQIHRPAGKLASIVIVKKLRNSALDFNPVQREHHIFTLQSLF